MDADREKSSLPGILGQIAAIAGPRVALEIARAQGGRTVSIPPRAADGHWLTDLVGLDCADRICRGLAIIDGDGVLKGVTKQIIPLGPTSLLKSARNRAAQALAAGATAVEAAQASGLHERTIWRIKANDDDQGSLF